MGVFVPQSKLQNLKKYKYQSEDRSILSKYILRPYWAAFVKIFPSWMAPNMVTLCGFGFVVINLLTVLLLNPGMDTETPAWTYFSYAIGLFLYQTFDACDGLHARRTGQSGPLGELFDHCIDSLNTTLSMIVFCATANTGYKFMTVLTQFGLLGNFYLSTWEEYHTHKLFLSEFSGPVEGILLTCLSYILTGIYGPEKVWHTKLGDLHLTEDFIFTVEILHVVYVFCGIGLLMNILAARRNVVEYYLKKSGSGESASREILLATIGLIPYFAYFGSALLISLLDSDFVSLPFVLSIGFTIAFTVGRIIVAHLTMQTYPMHIFPMYILPSIYLLRLFVVDILGYEAKKTIDSLNWLGLGLTMAIHGMFITEVIYEFTNYLDIYALTIKHKKTT